MSMPFARAVTMHGCCRVLTARSSRCRRPPDAGQLAPRKAGVRRELGVDLRIAFCREAEPAAGEGDHVLSIDLGQSGGPAEALELGSDPDLLEHVDRVLRGRPGR